MGTNKPVKITDAKSGLLRRLIDVTPSGKKLNPKEYKTIIKQVAFGILAYFIMVQFANKFTMKGALKKAHSIGHILVIMLFACLLFDSVGLGACDNGPKFKVQGEVTGAEDKTLYLEASGLEGIVLLDSVKLGGNGSFSFAEACPESPEFYRLRMGGQVINFAVGVGIAWNMI